MCETIANLPVPMEESSAYVLTEDMIDAAMTEQYTFHNGGESDEEQSSQEYIEMQSSTNEDTSDKDLQQTPDIAGELSNSNISIEDADQNRVFVMDSSLGGGELNVICENAGIAVEKNKSGETEPNIVTDEREEIHAVVAESHLPVSVEVADVQPESTDTYLKPEQPLFSALSPEERDAPAKPRRCLYSIDLCSSDTDELSPDEMPGGETVDDELQSVMESNLLAEFGINITDKAPHPSLDASLDSAISPTADLAIVPAAKSVVSPTTELDPMPKIAVKHIGHITTNDFDRIPTSCTEPPHVNVENRRPLMVKSPEISIASKDVPTAIQLNKIAVPNRRFVEQPGQKVKCVYMQTSSKSLPAFTKGVGGQSVLKNVKYIFSQKNGPLNIQSVLNKKAQASVKKIAPKTLAVAPKLMKGQAEVKGSVFDVRVDQHQGHEELVKSLLFHTLKSPYLPPSEDLQIVPKTFSCIECHDRFILELSLKNHLQRRTIQIHFWCRICKAEMHYYNRCVFLGHLRSHNISQYNIDSACINFSPMSDRMVEKIVTKTFLAGPIDLPKEDRILSTSPKPESGTVSSKPQSGGNTLVPAGVKGSAKNLTFERKSVGTSTASAVPLSASMSILISGNTDSEKNLEKKSSPLTASLLASGKPDTEKQQEKQVTADSSKSIMSLYNRIIAKGTNLPIQFLDAIPPNVVCEVQENGFAEDKDAVETRPDTEDSRLPKKGVKMILPKNGPQSTASAPSSKRCSECLAPCLNISKHLGAHSLPINPQLTCEVCQLILPTQCALKIHLRTHMQLPPFKCPDCGKDFAAWEELHAHLKFVCGHLAKCMRYMCLTCKTHFPSPTALGNHISSEHSRDIYKCTACPVAFFNKASLTKHLQNHYDLPAMGMDYKQCSICPKKVTEVVPIDRFMEHVREHVKNRGVVIYGYKCPICSAIFANKMPFIIHQIKEKEALEALEKEEIESTSGPGSKSSRKSNSPPETVPCEPSSKVSQNIKSPPDIGWEPLPTVSSDPSRKRKSPPDSNLQEPRSKVVQTKSRPETVPWEAPSTNSQEHSYKNKKSPAETTPWTEVAQNIKSPPETLSWENSSKVSHMKSSPQTISWEPVPDQVDEPEIVSKYPEAGPNSVEEKDPLSLEDWECTKGQTVSEKKEELCIVCKKNYVVLLPDIDLNNQSLCCRHCVRPLDEVEKRPEPFDQAPLNVIEEMCESFDKPLRAIHDKMVDKTFNFHDRPNVYEQPKGFSKNYSRKQTSGKRRTSDASGKSEENGLGDGNDASLPKKKGSKKKNMLSWDLFDTLDQIQGQVITAKTHDELVCSKCDFTSAVREAFQEHIREHRTDPNTYQCQECGLCFVVLPSLERHLQMSHRICSVRGYTESNPDSLPEKSIIEDDSILENQCRVCRQTFISASSLEKHFRTHGMAFMNSLSKSP